MSSGSYFTLYRRYNKEKAPSEVLDAIKNEYFLANKKDCFGAKQDDEAMKKDLPILMDAGFKSDHSEREQDSSKIDVYYDADGVKHVKLLEFSFCSTFTALKEHFNLNPYSFKQSSTLISKLEAEKILQAIEYILGEEYSKKFEAVLNNEYIKILGDGYSPFDTRFSKAKDPIYIEKSSRGNYTVNFNDYTFDAERAESDSDVVFSLNRTRACLLAFLNADESSWNGEELVLEYSAY